MIIPLIKSFYMSRIHKSRSISHKNLWVPNLQFQVPDAFAEHSIDVMDTLKSIE